MGKRNEQRETIRNYKDSIFRMVFSDKRELLALYNALNGTAYEDADALVVKTLENAIYMNIKNDLSFLLYDSLYLYEHQSTFNPNIPLRDLFYVADQLQEYVRKENLYRSTLMKIPTPEFVTFYNGEKEQPERRILRLSDAYEKQVEQPGLELVVTQLNINVGYNKALLEKCRTLRDYVLYVDKVRAYSKAMKTDEAVEQAVRECIRDDILKEFLLSQRSEAMKMTIYEFDQEEYEQMVREEGREEGRTEMLYELVQKGMLQIEDAAAQLNRPPAEMEADMQKKGYKIS